MQAQARSAHGLTAATFLLIGLAIANWPARAQTPDPSGVRAVPAYEAAGLQTSPITETAN